jgi:serpin B
MDRNYSILDCEMMDENLLLKVFGTISVDLPGPKFPSHETVPSFFFVVPSPVSAIEIPYKDDKASMVIFLPDTASGITEPGTSLDYKYYTDILESMQLNDVHLSIPKFKMDLQLELGSTLSRMGMPLAFSRDCQSHRRIRSGR